ncbi:hypothetical protein NE237_022733 [Protea cynaroides]|uniref:RING-type domain-containing protein n=1 Tax=Protea cynaroides TaxID=273540 RepID=A0A9Q0K3T9_9MAGN|nr:hypothetical protein NE237_022733 [Protea cynaroides]
MSFSYYARWSLKALTSEDSTMSELQISMIDNQTNLPFTFRFIDVYLKVRTSINNVRIINSELLEVKKKLFPFDSLSSYETLKPCIRDTLSNMNNFQLGTDLIEPLKEQITIKVCDQFRANQAREVRTVGFEIEVQFQTVEEYEDDEDTTMEDIIEATMDIEPAMVPASKDSIEKLINTKKLKQDEEIGEACTICLEELGVDVKVMPCGHAFHGDCIIKWLQQSHFCPMCRFSMPVEAD